MKRQLLLYSSMLVFIASLLYIGMYVYAYVENARDLEHIQDVYEAPHTTPTEQAIMNEDEAAHLQREQITKLHSINKDIVAWLQIEGTKLNNPVLQADDNDYYLTHNYKGVFSRAGSIFMDYRNDVQQLGKHTILYGHVMRDDSMFGGLSKYADEAYANDNRVIQFETLYGEYELHVFAAYETTTRFYYLETEFEGKAFGEFIQQIKARSRIDTGVDISVHDQIVTLSTCTTSDDDDERFVVHAKLVQK
ncbi:MAG: class B sortase [Caryophanon sp.]|nr:class B sortase [Caryophanon sp.]